MRHVVAAVVLVLLAGAADAQRAFLVNEPDWLPHGFSAIVADERQFYVAGNGLTRVRPDGTVVDPDPLPLPYDVHAAAEGAGLQVFVVSDDAASVYSLVAVTDDGAIAWKTDFPTGWASWRSAVVFDGTGFVVIAIPGTIGTSELRRSRFDTNGVLVSRDVLVKERRFVNVLTATRVDDAVLVVWVTADADVRYQLVAGDGEPLADGAIDTPKSIDHLSVASNGRGVLVVWSLVRGPLQAAVLVPVRRTGGIEVAQGPVTISDDVAADNYSWDSHAVAWDGGLYRLAWVARDGTTVKTADVSARLAIVRRAGLRFDAQWGDVHVAAGVGRVLFARNGKAVFADSGGAVDPDALPRPLALRRSQDSAPVVAFVDDRYVVVWRRGESELHGRFFDRKGVPLGPSFLVTDAADVKGDVQVAALWNTVLVTWKPAGGRSGVEGRRFHRDGDRLDGTPLCFPEARDAGIASKRRIFYLVEATGCRLRVSWLSASSPGATEEESVSLCDPAADGVDGLAGVEAVWDGQGLVVLYHLQLRSSPPGLPRYIPYLIRFGEGESTPLRLGDADSSRVRSLVAAGGEYVLTHPRRLLRVPLDLSAVAVAPNDAGENAVPLWTGSELLLLTGAGYEVRANDWTVTRRVALPPAEVTHERVRAGAADGSGRGLIVFVATSEFRPLSGVMAPVHSKRRAAGGE